VEGRHLGTLIWLVMVTGCRRGELCSLRWRDVDFEHSRLWITRSTSPPRSGRKEKDTKSGVDRRLSLDARTMSLLTHRRQRKTKQLADVGAKLTGDTSCSRRHRITADPDYPVPSRRSTAG
jgi:integrase